MCWAHGLSFPCRHFGWQRPVGGWNLLTLGANHSRRRCVLHRSRNHDRCMSIMCLLCWPEWGLVRYLLAGEVGCSVVEVGGREEIRGLPNVNPMTVVLGRRLSKGGSKQGNRDGVECGADIAKRRKLGASNQGHTYGGSPFCLRRTRTRTRTGTRTRAGPGTRASN